MQDKWFERTLAVLGIIGLCVLLYIGFNTDKASAATVCQIGNGCTGIGTAPSYGQVLVGNSSSGYTLTATSSLGISGGGSSASSTLLGDSNSFTGILDTFAHATTTLGTITTGWTTNWYDTYSSSTAKTVSGELYSGTASTSNLTVSNIQSALLLNGATGVTGAYGGTTCTNQFVRSLNGAGAATCNTVANTDLSHSTIVVNSTTLTLGDTSDTITAASSTLLGDSNTWSKLQTITSASTTNLTATSFWEPGQSSGCAQFDANAKLTSTGTNCGSGAGGITWPWTAYTNYGTTTIATSSPYQAWEGIFASSTSHFVNADFVQSTSTSLYDSGQTASTLAAFDANKQLISSSTVGWNLMKGPASSIFAFDNSGNPLATSSIGANYITGTLGTINTVSLTRGGSITVTAASSSLLSNNNTFSGTNIFSTNNLTLRDADNSWSGIQTPTRNIQLNQASTTWGVGTTSNPQVIAGSVTATFSGTIKNVTCPATTTAAFLGVTIFIGSTAVTPSYFVASNTVGVETLTSNNTFTAGQVIGMYVGTSTAAAGNIGVECVLQTVQTS